MMSDLRESGAIEADADHVWLLHRDETEDAVAELLADAGISQAGGRTAAEIADRFVEQQALVAGSDEDIRAVALIRRFLNRGVPILTGLSATYLYGCAREHEDEYDDLRGEPVGHFVVLSGYDRKKRQVTVADPSHDNPRFRSHRYSVPMTRLITAIALGVMTYDANLLVLTPKPTLGETAA